MDPEALISLVVFTGVVSVYRIGKGGAAVADVLPGKETLTDKVKRKKRGKKKKKKLAKAPGDTYRDVLYSGGFPSVLLTSLLFFFRMRRISGGVPSALSIVLQI